MAFDRWLTLYGVAPFRRLFIRREDRVLPILMYHSISDEPEIGVNACSPARSANWPQTLSEEGNWAREGERSPGKTTARP
jgi:hypothetical protein